MSSSPVFLHHFFFSPVSSVSRLFFLSPSLYSFLLLLHSPDSVLLTNTLSVDRTIILIRCLNRVYGTPCLCDCFNDDDRFQAKEVEGNLDREAKRCRLQRKRQACLSGEQNQSYTSCQCHSLMQMLIKTYSWFHVILFNDSSPGWGRNTSNSIQRIDQENSSCRITRTDKSCLSNVTRHFLKHELIRRTSLTWILLKYTLQTLICLQDLSVICLLFLCPWTKGVRFEGLCGGCVSPNRVSYHCPSLVAFQRGSL